MVYTTRTGGLVASGPTDDDRRDMDGSGAEVIPGLLFGIFGLVFAVIGIASIGLWIWMLVDAIQVPDDRFYKSGTKVTWVLVVALLGGLGALIYFFAGRPTPETRQYLKEWRERGGQAGGHGGQPTGMPEGWQQPGTPPQSWQQPGTPPQDWQGPDDTPRSS